MRGVSALAGVMACAGCIARAEHFEAILVRGDGE
jgi:hypothetical protein